MDAGVVVTNPYRFKATALPDGSQVQVSTIQFCYDEIARTSREAFSAEYQSEVVEEQIDQEAFISSAHIQKRVSGFAKYVVPDACKILTQGIDIGKQRLNCVVRAWRPDGTGFTIEYDALATSGTVYGSDEGVDEAIERALHERKEFVDQQPYKTPDGKPVGIQLTLIDAKYRSESVFQFCRQAGPRWMSAMGCGDTESRVSKSFNAPIRSTTDKRPGNRWYRSRRQHGLWLVMLDSNYWIQWEHDHWMRPSHRRSDNRIHGGQAGDKSPGWPLRTDEMGESQTGLCL
jgi:phage terminase large subunit GpA-like protein